MYFIDLFCLNGKFSLGTFLSRFSERKVRVDFGFISVGFFSVYGVVSVFCFIIDNYFLSGSFFGVWSFRVGRFLNYLVFLEGILRFRRGWVFCLGF